MNNTEFSSVTEVTGYNVTKEQIQRIYTRYRFAAEFCSGKDVLEVACGSGQGLGYLAKKAKSMVGGDIDEKILAKAKEHYRERKNITLKILDAQKLPFADNSFDTVILYEAIYYLSDHDKFIDEAYRLLRKEGVLLICTVNKDWADFNPSPYSYRYFSASELTELLKQNGFLQVSLYGGCLANAKNTKDKIISLVKRTAVNLHLIPKTMKGKEALKRIFCGKLSSLPPEVYDGMAEYTAPVTIDEQTPNREYKVLFALGYKP